MGELPAGVRKNKEPVDRKWMQSAIERDQLRRAEGYTPPVHLRHHGKGKHAERVGHFALKRVGKHRYEGRDIDALFADLTGIPDEQFQRIKRGDMPYRSVEIHNFDTPEVQSLALLDSEVPYFRLPNLRVDVGDPKSAKPAPPTRFANAEAPAIAFCATSDGASALFRFTQESNMDEQIAALTATVEELKEQVAKLQAEVVHEPDAEVTEEERIAEMAPAIPAEEILQADIGGITVSGGGVVDLAAQSTVTQLSAEVAALRDSLAERDRKDAAKTAYEGALAALDGYPVSEETRAHFKSIADTAPALLANAVKTYKATALRDPPEDIDASFDAESDAPEVAKFAAQGPDALATARALSKDYEAYRRAGGSADLDTYLSVNVKRPVALSGAQED